MTALRDKNASSSRLTLLKKYDKNGDGIYQTDEVNAIVDDYMATMQTNTNLILSNETQKKVIIFCIIMIVLLAISNFATAFLAVNLAKEMKVSADGTMRSNDGNDTALKTLSKVESIAVPGNAALTSTSDRNLEEEDKKIGCLTPEEAMIIYKNAQEGSGTSLIVQDEFIPGTETTHFIGGTAVRSLREEDGNYERRLLAAEDELELDDFVYWFPDSEIELVYTPKGCTGDDQRRRASESRMDKRMGRNRMLDPGHPGPDDHEHSVTAQSKGTR